MKVHHFTRDERELSLRIIHRKMSTVFSLLDLPQELLISEILGRLGFRDVLHCSIVRWSSSLLSHIA